MIKNSLKERAITLIALVITIIVLLILAGVSIAMLTGENGILNQAKEGKETYIEEAAAEKLKLALLDLNSKKIAKEGRNLLLEELTEITEKGIKV